MNDTKDVEELIRNGLEALSINSTQKALDLFSKAIAKDPENTMAWNNKGVALRKMGKIEDAIDCYNKALSISPDLSQALMNKARALRILKKFDLALFTYEEILELDSEHQEAKDESERVRMLLSRQVQISAKSTDKVELEKKEQQLLKERKQELKEFLNESQLSISDSVQRIGEMFVHGIKEEAIDQREKISRAIISFNNQITERVKLITDEFSLLDFEEECREQLDNWQIFKNKMLKELQKMT